MTSRVLVIDDEPAIRDTMRMILEYEGYDCLTAGSGAEGLAMVERESPDRWPGNVEPPAGDQ